VSYYHLSRRYNGYEGTFDEFFDLFLWSLAVFVWRLTVPDSPANYVAFVVLATCGVQTLFNFNPLLKLDGYYLLSDWLDAPNLRQVLLAPGQFTFGGHGPARLPGPLGRLRLRQASLAPETGPWPPRAGRCSSGFASPGSGRAAGGDPGRAGPVGA